MSSLPSPSSIACCFSLIWEFHSTNTMLLIPKLLLASAAGILSHLGFFIRGEHDQQAPVLFTGFFACYALYLVSSLDRGLQQAINESTSISMVYCSTIWTSMIIYRLYFHRLAHFPGPYMARVSKFWQVIRNSTSPNYLEINTLHSRYGTFVRTGRFRSRLVSQSPESSPY